MMPLHKNFEKSLTRETERFIKYKIHAFFPSVYTMFHPLKQAYAFILDKRFQYPSIDLTPRTWVISYNFQWTIGTFTIRVDEVASPLHTHHTHFRNSIAWSTWVNRPRAMLWMMHFRRSYSPLLFSFLVFYFLNFPFYIPDWTPCTYKSAPCSARERAGENC